MTRASYDPALDRARPYAEACRVKDGGVLATTEGESRIEQPYINWRPTLWHQHRDADSEAFQVSAGVRFYPRYARVYWRFVNENLGINDEVLYGPELFYEGRTADWQHEKGLYDSLWGIARLCAEEAYEQGYRQCAECGGHYLLASGRHCCP